MISLSHRRSLTASTARRRDGPVLWLPVAPERRFKTERLLRFIQQGWKEPAQLVYAMPPNNGDHVLAYGQLGRAAEVLRQATATDRPYWHVDNGYWLPGRGTWTGYYRFCWRGMWPQFLPSADATRAKLQLTELQARGIYMCPWRQRGTHILLGLPGEEYASALGFDMPKWIAWIREELPKFTDRPIIVRERKGPAKPLALDLKNCWAVVTHSSNIAVDAVLAGIPAFVEPTCAAAPVGNLSLTELENPYMPDREAWFASLACQQFNFEEMRSGLAYDYLRAIRDAA